MKKITIVLMLIVAQIIAFSLLANAQIKSPEIIADETTIVEMKNDCKIETDNERIVKEISKKWDANIKRLQWSIKTDRHGKYKHYVIHVSKEDGQLIKSWAKSNL